MNVVAAATAASAGSTRALWYFTRGFGVASLVMLTAVMVLGVLTSVRWAPPRVARFVVDGLHRNLSMLSVAFLAVHVATAVIDGFAPIGWLDAVVPFRSAYRPVWLGLGAVATDLLLAVAITSLVRVRLGHRTWRVVHWFAYACWPIALVHGVGTGTDGGRMWMLVLDAAAVTVVMAVVWWRLASSGPGFAPVRIASGVVSVAVLVAMIAWATGGPMQPGWARAAGTPARLRSERGKVVKAVDAASTISPIEPFTASLDGKIHQGTQTSDGRMRIEMRADVALTQPLVFDAILDGYVGGTGGLVVRRGAVELGPRSDPTLYRGALTTLEGGRLGAQVIDERGNRLDLDVTLGTGAASGTITGELHAEKGSATRVDNESSEHGEGSEGSG